MQAARRGGGILVGPIARGQPKRCEQWGCQPCNAQTTSHRITGHRKPLAEQLPNWPLQGVGFAEITVGQRRKVMEIKQSQSFLERCFLTQGFDTLRVPSWIEFTFCYAISRGKP